MLPLAVLVYLALLQLVTDFCLQGSSAQTDSHTIATITIAGSQQPWCTWHMLGCCSTAQMSLLCMKVVPKRDLYTIATTMQLAALVHLALL